MDTPITQTRRDGGIVNFLVGLVCVAMFVAFSLLIADRLGYLPSAPVAPPIPPPTPIIRVVAPAPPAQLAPAAEQPAQPAVVAPQPVVAPAPAVEQPTPATRQIIIIKNGNDPAAAPIVIDRGTKRRSP